MWSPRSGKDHEDNFEKLEAAVDETGSWKDTSHVSRKTTLIFHNIAVVLNPDGTYFLMDMSG